MSKRKRKAPPAGSVAEMVTFMRRMNREAIVADMREGRVQKAQMFTDRKSQANRQACRGKFFPAD